MNNVKIMVDTYKCTGCSICSSLCPYGYITVRDGELGFPVPHLIECKNCGNCIKGCPFSDEHNDDDDE